MFTFDRFTTLYVPQEDRITLVGEGKAVGNIRLWLIRPLTDKLVLALADVMKPRTGNLEHAEAIASFAQSSAEQRFEPSPAVKFLPEGERAPHGGGVQAEPGATEGTPTTVGRQSAPAGFPANEWLVREISLTIQEGRFVFTFSGADDRKAKCSFSEQRLRQWLAILRQVCRKAGWTNPDWPEWMKEPATLVDPTSSVH